MRHTLRGILFWFVIICLGWGLAACSTGEDNDGAQSPSIGDGNPPIDDVPVGEVEGSGFWLNALTNGQFSVYLQKRDEWGERCYISSDTTDNEFVTCILDIMETDFFVYDLEIQYNAPPGLCDHVTVAPSWFWNYSSGVGPAYYEIDVDTSGANPVRTRCEVTVSNELETAVEGGVTDNLIDCDEHPELAYTADGTDVTCTYNYNPVGPNCCFGDFTEVRSVDDGTSVNVTTTENEWGGSGAACISPHLSTGWNLTTPNGFPKTMIQAVPVDEEDVSVGLNEVITLGANTSGLAVGFSLWGNWWETVGQVNSHTHSGFYSATTTNEPYAFNPVDDLSGTPMRSGRAPWTFTCLDAAGEIRHRIDLYIREWNTVSDFLAYGSSEGVDYDPDVSGVGGSGCDYDPIFNYDGCNDFADFDDLLNGIGGSYPTAPAPGTPGTGVTNTDRRTYFPEIEPD
jgi:hypothetical protein